MQPNVLFLEDVPNADRLASLLGALPSHAESPLEVAWALTSEPPDVMVVGTGMRWAHDLLAALGPGRRPAVIAVGDMTDDFIDLVDEWLPRGATQVQIERCFANLGRALALDGAGDH